MCSTNPLNRVKSKLYCDAVFHEFLIYLEFFHFRFILPGGTFKFKDEEDVELPMIKGTLASWGPLTAALAQALDELQSGGKYLANLLANFILI